MRTFLTKERDAGFALKGDDIVSVFKHPSAPYRNVTKSMLDLAKQNGGKRLDAFDTVLPHLYAQSGFRTVARLPWNEEYKPEGWKHDTFKEFNKGRPDVVFMAHDPQAGSYQPWDGKRIADYDEGERHQRAALAQVEARGNVPAAPGPEAYGSGQLIRHAAPLPVFHGTPHEFRGTRANPLGEFDMSKIGTGEGAQAYGVGPYVAGSRAVGEGYQRDLAKGVTYKGDVPRYSRTDPHAHAVHQVAEHMHDLKLTPAQAIEKVGEEYKNSAANTSFPMPDYSVTQQEARRRHHAFHLGVHMAAQRLKPEDFAHDQGHLYEAEMHIHPDHLLDWDRPIGEQHPYVQHHAQKLVPPKPDGIVQLPDGQWSLSADGQPVSHPHAGRTSFPDASLAQYALATIRAPRVHNMTGEQLHNHLFNNADVGLGKGNGPAAAKALLDAGIPGIKYLDRGSRAAAARTQLDIRDTENALASWKRALGSGSPQTEAETQKNIDRLQQELDRLRAGKHISHNYVVFDPRTLHIVRRNGLPAMVDAGADALRDHKAGG